RSRRSTVSRRRCCPICAPRRRKSSPTSETSARSPATTKRRWSRSLTISPRPSPEEIVAPHGHPQGTAEPHPLHPLDAENHVGAEDGGGVAVAARAGAGGS